MKKQILLISILISIITSSCTANFDYTYFEYDDEITVDDAMDVNIGTVHDESTDSWVPEFYKVKLQTPAYNVYSKWVYTVITEDIVNLTFTGSEGYVLSTGLYAFTHDTNNSYSLEYDGMDIYKSSIYIKCNKDALYNNGKVIKFKVQATLDNGL